jgi:sucrose-phosphate synthase
MEFHHIVPQDGDIETEPEGLLDHPAPQDPAIWSEVWNMLSAFLLMFLG